MDSGYSYLEGTLYPKEKKIALTWLNSWNDNKSNPVLVPYDPKVGYRSVKRTTFIGSASSSPQNTAPAPQSTLKTYTVTVYYERNGARLPHFAVVQASSPMEATMLGRIEWENSALGQYKYLSASVSGGF
jgi:hypothetical protein